MIQDPLSSAVAVALVFYRGRGDWMDRLIRLCTGSPYSHCEIRVGRLCYTSHQGRRGVTAMRRDTFADWDAVPLPNVRPDDVLRFFRATHADGYNWLGVLAAAFRVGYLPRGRWHCAQWCAAAIGAENPARITPGGLYRLVCPAPFGATPFTTTVS